MNNKDLTKKYWHYYLLLEKRFLSTIDYVEIDRRNYSCFSNEYALLIQAVGSELDCFFKEYCGINKDTRASIKDYATIILADYPDIVSQVITIQNTKLLLQPFNNWDVNQAAKSLKWWTAFDLLKHNRYDNFSKANLENVLNTLSALYLMEMKYYMKNAQPAEPNIPEKSSDLFELVGWKANAIPMKNALALI